MKKLILVAFVLSIAFVGFGQSKSAGVSKSMPKKNAVSPKSKVEEAKIFVDKQFDYGETYRTFSITQLNIDRAKAKFIQNLGTPSINSLSTLQWKNINLPEIGENLTITLHDGVVEKNEEGISYTIFTDKKMKVKALQNLTANKFRMLSFKITNSENINVIRNNKLEEEGLLFLESLEL